MIYKLIKDLDKALDKAEFYLASNQIATTQKCLHDAGKVCDELYKIFPQPTRTSIFLKPTASVEETREQIEQLRRVSMIFSFAVTYNLLDHIKKAVGLDIPLQISLQINDLMNKMILSYNKAVAKGLGQTEVYIDFPQDFHYLTSYHLKVMPTQKKQLPEEVENNLTKMCNLFKDALNFNETQNQFGMSPYHLSKKQQLLFFPSSNDTHEMKMEATPSINNQM